FLRGIGQGLGFERLGLGVAVEYLALEDPDLDADDAVSRLRLGRAVVDVSAERVQRNAALAGPLRARDLGAVQAAGDPHFHAQGAAAHRVRDRALHGAAEHHALLDLLRDALGDQGRVELGLPDLRDVEPHVRDRHLHEPGDLDAQLLDVLALAADHDARPGRVDRDVGLARGALDVDPADRSFLQLGAQEFAHPPVGQDERREALGIGIPARRPVARDAETDADRIDLLTHVAPCSPSYRALSATVILIWLKRLTIRLPRPLARAANRFATGAASTSMRATDSVSMSASWLCSAFAIADSSTLRTSFAPFFGV